MALARRLGALHADLERDLRRDHVLPDGIEVRVQSEQARLFWSQSYLLIGLGIAIGLAVVVAQWAVLEPGRLLGWLALLLVVSAAWGGGAVAWARRGPCPGHDRPWVQAAAATALGYGVAWSTGALLLFPDAHFAHQAILTVMLAGLSAGAITVLSSISVTGVAVVIPALLPLAYQFALSDHRGARLILAMLLVFLLTLVMANRHLYTTLSANIRLRLEKAMSEAALHESESRYRLMFNQSPLGVIHYDAGGTVLDCNTRLADILATPRDAVIGSNLLASTDERLAAAVRRSLDAGRGYYEDTFEPPGAAPHRPLRAFFNAVGGAGDARLGGVGIIEDFTQRKEAERALHDQAHYDPLTGLPNRRLLGDRLGQALAAARRHGRRGALVFLDVDHFKRINDRLGHAAGDRVLCGVAERITGAVRAEDTVARLSGDEFIVLLREVGGTRAMGTRGARAVCDKIQAALGASIHTPEGDVRLTASLGVALFPQGESGAEELLRRSDTAMYRAKREIRGEIRFYDTASDGRHAVPSADLEHDLRFALEHEQLELHYQPLFDDAGATVGAEALLRWRHPVHGLIPPDRFIPVAEDSGQIIPIGRWVLEEAGRALHALAGRGCRHLPIAINVSANEFHHAGFASHVEATLDRLGLRGGDLMIEITERVTIDRVRATVETMNRLRRRGVRFALDDFGTGHSSLSYLKRLPVDIVKIDRDFVRDLERDKADAAIVEGILAMASRLELEVVAEGVETGEQFARLCRAGCVRFQGFYRSPPAPFDEAFAGELAEPAPAPVPGAGAAGPG